MTRYRFKRQHRYVPGVFNSSTLGYAASRWEEVEPFWEEWTRKDCMAEPFAEMTQRLEGDHGCHPPVGFEVKVPMGTDSMGTRADWVWYSAGLRALGFVFEERRPTPRSAMIVTINFGTGPEQMRPMAGVVLVHLLRYFSGEFFEEDEFYYHPYFTPALRTLRESDEGKKLNFWALINAAWLAATHSPCSHCMSATSFLSISEFDRLVLNWDQPSDGTTYHFNNKGEYQQIWRMTGTSWFSDVDRHNSPYVRKIPFLDIPGYSGGDFDLPDERTSPVGVVPANEYLVAFLEATKGAR